MLKRPSLAFTVLLGAMGAVPPLSTDVGLPSFAASAVALGTDQATMTLTLSFFLFGFAIGPLVHGPVSERFGRRPVLLAGLGLYLVCSLLCTLTPSISLLLAARLIQGFAASAPTVLSLAIIRDLFEGLTARRQISRMMLVNGLMPLTAPSIGVAVLALAGWRAIYATMTLCGLFLALAVLFGFAESIPNKKPDALAPGRLIGGYAQVMRHGPTIRASLVNALCFGALFAYISGSPLLFLDTLHLSQRAYGVVFAVPVLGLMVGTIVNDALISRHILSPVASLRGGLGLVIGASGLILLLIASGYLALAPLLVLLLANNIGLGLIRPNASYSAVQYMPHLAGVASAVLAFTQMIAGSLAAALVAALFNVMGINAMGATMLLCAVLAGLLHIAFPTAPTPSAGGTEKKAAKSLAGSDPSPL